jgi:signal transduction histidine kinase
MLSRAAAFPLVGLRSASDSPAGLSKGATLSLSPFLPTLLGALVVAISYYAGSELGFFLKPDHTTIATIWPPSAILLAAFLLAPTQVWWVFLVATLPAHLLAQVGSDTSLLTALGWFIANTCGPLLGAALIRRSKQENRLFDSWQGIIVFLAFGVFLPPLVKSFLNAIGTLQIGRQSDYWMLWTTRLSSNIISDLILIPTIVLFGRNGISWLRSAKLARYFEAGLLGLCTVVVCLLVFGRESSAPRIPALVYAPLLPLLWAAVRFGQGGLSASMLGVALISIWNATHGRGPFGTSSMVQDMLVHGMLSLHSLLMVFGLPLMLMAALIAERCRDEGTLRNARRSLIYAHEREIHRVGRELRDDIVERLTLVGISVDQLRTAANASVKPTLDELYTEICRVFKDTHDLSHEVYPFIVEYLGLGNALKKLCRDTGRQSGVTISFSAENKSLYLPSEVSHRLFGVAREALRNVSKHSHAKSATVELEVNDGRVLLRIADDGVGMVLQRGEGMGLIWMREQLLSLEGTFKATSAPGRGMVIEASAPIKLPGSEHPFAWTAVPD